MTKNIIKSYLAQVVGTVGVAAVSMGLTFVIARLLGPDYFGVYSYALTVGALAALIQDGGFKTLLFREAVSATPSLAPFKGRLGAMAIGHLIIVSAIIFLFVAWLPVPDKGAVNTALICFTLLCLSWFVSGHLKGNGLFVEEASWQILVRFVSAGAILVTLFVGGRTAEFVFIGWAVGIVICLCFKKARGVFRPPIFLFDKKLYMACLSLIAIDMATQLYSRSDILMLRWMGRSSPELGGYSAAYRLLEGVGFVVWPVSQIWFRQFRQLHMDIQAFRNIFNQRIAIMALFSFLFVLGAWHWGPWFISFLFGEAYSFSGQIFVILALALPFTMTGVVVTQAFLALGYERLYAKGAMVAAVVNILLNYFAIPIYGAVGAAVTTVVTEALLTSSLFYVLWLEFKRKERSSG